MENGRITQIDWPREPASVTFEKQVTPPVAMIKKILVALDPDSDTPVATQYAVDVAHRFDAQITGLAVVDMGSIASSVRGGGIGSMYYAEKLREKLTSEARNRAERLLQDFESTMQEAEVGFMDMVQEGVPFRRIVEDMKYHDLLIIGKTPHFFYSHPKQHTETLARVVRKTLGPSLLVGSEYTSVKRVLIAFDGSDAAAEAMRSFVSLSPFGKDLDVRLLSIYEGRAAEAELMLDLAASYMRAHGFEPSTIALQDSDIESVIIDQIRAFGADLVVAGAHSRSRIKAFAFGSTTEYLVNECPVALFLDS